MGWNHPYFASIFTLPPLNFSPNWQKVTFHTSLFCIEKVINTSLYHLFSLQSAVSLKNSCKVLSSQRVRPAEHVLGWLRRPGPLLWQMDFHSSTLLFSPSWRMGNCPLQLPYCGTIVALPRSLGPVEISYIKATPGNASFHKCPQKWH